MKVLIICAGWGTWIKPFIKEMEKMNGIEMYVLNVYHGSLQNHEKSISVDIPPKELHGNLKYNTFQKYNKVIQEICPDIIQVFGTENNFGQIARYLNDIPVVVHLQGILTCCSTFRDAYLHGNELRRYYSLKNYFGFGGSSLEKQVKKNEIPEVDILKNNRFFFGRTMWDRNVVYFFNKKAYYFVGEELLRDAFYKNAGGWKVDSIERHTIFMPSGFNPIKGMHIALEAINLLKRDYPDIKIYIPGVESKFIYGSTFWRYLRGEAYTNYLSNMIAKNELKQHVILTGRLNSEEMVQCMKHAHVFLSPSVIDNSPNAVGEATMIGVPIVATYVGGVPTIIENGQNGLLVNSGDSYMIAAAIDKIFRNDELAMTFSKKALQTAQKRHNRTEITKQYIKNYQDIIENYKIL